MNLRSESICKYIQRASITYNARTTLLIGFSHKTVMVLQIHFLKHFLLDGYPNETHKRSGRPSKQLAAAMFLYCGESSGQLIRLLTPGVNITIEKKFRRLQFNVKYALFYKLIVLFQAKYIQKHKSVSPNIFLSDSFHLISEKWSMCPIVPVTN
jgi:hypothetical protein